MKAGAPKIDLDLPEPEAPASYSPHVLALSDVQTQAIHWLWEGRIPLGKLTLLDGDPGLGKSTLAYDLAARLSAGREMPDDSPGIGGAVSVFLTMEDDPADTIRPRLLASGGNPRLVLILDGLRRDGDAEGRRIPVSLVDHLPQIERAIQDNDAKLFVIDPLMAFLVGREAKSGQEMSETLSALAEILQRTGCAGLALRHLNKRSAGGKAIYAGMYSVSIIGVARSGLFVEKHPEDPDTRVLAVSKSNLAEPASSLGFRLEGTMVHGEPGDPVVPSSRVAWTGPVDFSADDLTAVRSAGPRVQECVRTLLELVPEGEGVPASEAKEALKERGFSKKVVTEALKTAGVESVRPGGNRGPYFWRRIQRGNQGFQGGTTE